MDDVEALCRRIIMIDAGTVLFDGTPEALRHRYVHQRTLTVTPAAGTDPAAIRVDGATSTVTEGKTVLTHDPAVISTPDLIAAVTASWPVTDLTVTEASLTDVVARMYAEAPR